MTTKKTDGAAPIGAPSPLRLLDGLNAPLPPPSNPAEETPPLYDYEVVFESGLPVRGSSMLDPEAFEKAVFEAQPGARVQWTDHVEVLDDKGKKTGRLKATPGGGFRASKVVSVRWVDGE